MTSSPNVLVPGFCHPLTVLGFCHPMKGDRVELGRTEQRRLLVLNQLQAGGLVNAEAAGLLGLSVRQVQRLRGAYGQLVAAALVHGNPGPRSARALSPTP